MDNETKLPMDWKPLREAAEIDAQVVHNLFAFLTWSVTDGWSELDDDAQDTLVRVQATLLSDLTRPTARDFWARWLAAKVGLEVWVTAPEWRRFRMALPNGTESWAWALLGTPGEQFIFTDGNAASISTLTNPAAALRAALLAVEPA